MIFHTTETVCALTGTHEANLRRWQRRGLISTENPREGWSEAQLDEIYLIKAHTAGGASLNEIQWSHTDAASHRLTGWPARKGDLLWLLEFGSERALLRSVRNMAGDFSSEDFINLLMRPLNRWLRDDRRQGAEQRLERFHHCVILHFYSINRAADRNCATPLFLEAISVTDTTEIWLEAIRLTGEGFCVEISSEVSETPAVSQRHYDHHLLWCGAGISKSRYQLYCDSITAGQPVLLCGTDKQVNEYH
ncbi:MerR family transcriptional regulator [Erwinia oleae]|uniref:MerR family transcriptional regulator n=1 Tax=Erwinia oleae TaxID=796334 RepID=UPI0005529437|nr:MerR family transcriptional regulator [Erwinia oleae]